MCKTALLEARLICLDYFPFKNACEFHVTVIFFWDKIQQNSVLSDLDLLIHMQNLCWNRWWAHTCFFQWECLTGNSWTVVSRVIEAFLLKQKSVKKRPFPWADIYYNSWESQKYPMRNLGWQHFSTATSGQHKEAQKTQGNERHRNLDEHFWYFSSLGEICCEAIRGLAWPPSCFSLSQEWVLTGIFLS